MGGWPNDKMMQVHLLEQNKRYKWYIKWSKWLLYDVIHKPKVMHLTFRLHFIRGVMEKHKLKVPSPSVEPSPHSLTLSHSLTFTHWTSLLKRGKKLEHQTLCVCDLVKTREDQEFSLVLTVKLVCVSMAASRLNLQISTSEAISISHMYTMCY